MAPAKRKKVISGKPQIKLDGGNSAKKMLKDRKAKKLKRNPKTSNNEALTEPDDRKKDRCDGKSHRAGAIKAERMKSGRNSETDVSKNDSTGEQIGMNNRGKGTGRSTRFGTHKQTDTSPGTSITSKKLSPYGLDGRKRVSAFGVWLQEERDKALSKERTTPSRKNKQKSRTKNVTEEQISENITEEIGRQKPPFKKVSGEESNESTTKGISEIGTGTSSSQTGTTNMTSDELSLEKKSETQNKEQTLTSNTPSPSRECKKRKRTSSQSDKMLTKDGSNLVGDSSDAAGVAIKKSVRIKDLEREPSAELKLLLQESQKTFSTKRKKKKKKTCPDPDDGHAEERKKSLDEMFILKQRNVPKFVKQHGRKKFFKHLISENEEKVARQAMLTDWYELSFNEEDNDSENELEDEVKSEVKDDLEDEVKNKLQDGVTNEFKNEEKSEDEDEVDDKKKSSPEVADSDREDDYRDALEYEERMFKLFGHDQDDSGNTGVFGSRSQSFIFSRADNTDLNSSDINDSGYSVEGGTMAPEDTEAVSIETDGKTDEQDGKMDNEDVSKDVHAAKVDKVEQWKEADAKPAPSDTGAMKEESRCVTIPVPGEEAAIVVIAHPFTLCIQGKALITMVTGQIAIMGHNLREDNSYKIYSPYCHSYAALTTCEGESNVSLVGRKVSNILDHRMTGAEICDEKLKSFKDEHCVAFLVRPLDSAVDAYVSGIYPYQGLFTVRTKEELLHNVELLPLGLGLFPLEFVMRPWLRLTKDVEHILNLWEEMLKRGDKSVYGRPPVILICGCKNSGKSTLARYLINSALNVSEEVNYLELDLGQTEFSPPGCVGMYNLSEPLFGPPFTHLKKAESLCYLGDVTSHNVTEYVKCVEFVYKAYPWKKPLIINTMGWTTGMGLNLLVDMLYVMNPDVVIQINGYQRKTTLPPITPEYKWNTPGWLYNTQPRKKYRKRRDDHELCIVGTPVRQMQGRFITMKAVYYRNIALLTYLCAGLSPRQTLLSLPPFVVSWSKVAVHVCNAEIDAGQTLMVLNGNVVGLCCAMGLQTAVEDTSGPRLLQEYPVCQCVGFGLVRGIDPIKKLLYIVTPVDLDDLVKVNLLIKGVLDLPENVVQNAQKRLYWDSVAVGGGMWKQRKQLNLKRPGHSRSGYKT